VVAFRPERGLHSVLPVRLSVVLCVSLFCSLAALACGRVGLDLGSDGADGSAGSSGASGSGGTMGAAGTNGTAGSGTGSGGSGGVPVAPARVPTVHRPTAASCPIMTSPPSLGMCPFGNPGVKPADWCFSDADCTSGKDGRCEFSINRLCTCSYDACFSDADCPGGALCMCGASYSSNTCMSGSCHVDADCGAGGFCSPVVDGCSGQVIGYACHTAKDTCSDNKDCPYGSSCAPEFSTGAWGCGPGDSCPI
jgi:hypothetical protein